MKNTEHTFRSQVSWITSGLPTLPEQRAFRYADFPGSTSVLPAISELKGPYHTPAGSASGVSGTFQYSDARNRRNAGRADALMTSNVMSAPLST